MKRILFTLFVIFGLVFVMNSGANALDFPDSNHEFIGSEEFPGHDIAEGSVMVSNLFNVSEGTEITFDFNLLTAELSDTPDPGESHVNDFFAAIIMDPYTSEVYEGFMVADILTSTFDPITDGISGTDGPHGSLFTYQTGVTSGSITVAGTYTDVSLAFGVFDVGDADVDTGVLLDNISGPVPSGYFDSGLVSPIYVGSYIGGLIFPPDPFIFIEEEGNHMYGGNVHLLSEGDGSLSGVDTTGLSGNYAYMSTGPGDNTPPIVPEPISSVLFLIGGATLGFRRFRQNK